jgi:phosphatidylglycerol lysyltransferase
MSNKKESFRSVQITSLLVAIYGLLLVSGTLVNELSLHSVRLNRVSLTVPAVGGITLLYFASLLRRRKRTAWFVVILVYMFLFGINLSQYAGIGRTHIYVALVRLIILPVITMTLLLVDKKKYNVKSDVESFTAAMKTILIVFIVALVYGAGGYLLLDNRDFRQEISVTSAIHHTLDQFNLTTSKQLVPYTRKAQVFVDSLNIISVVAVGYALISLFQPLRSRYGDQSHHRELAEQLLKTYSSDSEDFFKIWPHDKNYHFNPTNSVGIAFHERHGIALIVGEPFGVQSSIMSAVAQFDDLCHLNDWKPAYIHIADTRINDFKQQGYNIQKIGEEAVVSVEKFRNSTIQSKYFRQITNRFGKQSYTTEILQPPHSSFVINRLNEISAEWLMLPGRQERGFMMGYHKEAYLQHCNLIVAKDDQGTIQGYLNVVPTYTKNEANFDMVRHAKTALGNINDYLIMELITYAETNGYKAVNLGLCPLSGLAKKSEEGSFVDSALRFFYANGDRFYSFSGLHRFKSKYEPTWRSRNIAYRGGTHSLPRILNNLNKVMKIK